MYAKQPVFQNFILSKFIILLCFCLSLHAQTGGLKCDQKLTSAAAYYARHILNASSIKTTLFNIYYNIDETPYAFIYDCTDENDSRNSVVLGIASSSANYPLLFFAIGKAADVEKFLSHYASQKIYATRDGYYIKKGGVFRKIPEQYYDKTVPGNQISGLEIRNNETDKYPSDANLIASAWQKALSYPSIFKRKADTTEVRLMDVPLYLWYLNCGITMWTMYLAYWNDKGYSDIVPGGNSKTGHYWAVADELCYIEESPDLEFLGANRMVLYVSVPDYGYHYTSSYKEYNAVILKDIWPQYRETIEKFRHPLSVGWTGAPYGAHATLGVGFRIIDSLKFFILHDTWHDVPYYINYYQYQSSCNGCGLWSIDSINAYPQRPDYTKFPLSSRTISLRKVTPVFSPDLNTDKNSYHTFIFGDINGDDKTEFFTGRFNNYSNRSLLLYTLSDTSFISAEGFWPFFVEYCCFEDIELCAFDNDNKQDAAVTGYFSPVYLFKSIGREMTGIHTTLSKTDTGVRGFTSIEFGDIDNDGDKDLVAAPIDGRLFIYRNDFGTFSRVQVIDNRRQSLKIKLLDMNNDGLLDIVTSFRTKSIALFYNKNGSFGSVPDYMYQSGSGAMSFAAGDIDNDGFEDIITTDKGNLMVFKNLHGTLTKEPSPVFNEIPCYARDMKLADLDRDGFSDLIVANYNTPDCIFISDSGRFNARPSWIAPNVDPSYKISVWYSKDSLQMFIGYGKSRGGSLDFYAVEQPAVSVEEKPGAGRSDNFNLYQNYPNPFNLTTTIAYRLPFDGRVALRIINVLGETVTALVNEYQSAGSYKYIWNASNLSSGIYFYRLTIEGQNNYTSSHKMVLMK